MFSQIWRRRDVSSFGYSSTNHVAMTLVTPPAIEPVTLNQLKQHARIAYPDSDDTLSLYLVAARQKVEKYLRRVLITQTWDFRCDWGPAWVELPWPQLQQVNGVFTTGLDNVELTVPTATYITDVEHNFVGLNIGQVWPLHRGRAGFRINYTSGYGSTAASVPAEIQRVILAVATAMDATRDDPGLTETLKDALIPYRVSGQPFRMAKGMSREDVLG